MNKEEMLLEALNKFGNFNTVTQEFNEEKLGVIYELIDMVEQRHKVSGADTSDEPALPIQNVSGSASKNPLDYLGSSKSDAFKSRHYR